MEHLRPTIPDEIDCKSWFKIDKFEALHKYETPVQHVNDLKWSQMDLKWGPHGRPPKVRGEFEDLQHFILHVCEVHRFSN